MDGTGTRSAPPVGLPHSHGGAQGCEAQHSTVRLAWLCLCHHHGAGTGDRGSTPAALPVPSSGIPHFVLCLWLLEVETKLSPPPAQLLPCSQQQDSRTHSCSWRQDGRPVPGQCIKPRDFSFQIPPLPRTAGPGQAQLVWQHPGACLWADPRVMRSARPSLLSGEENVLLLLVHSQHNTALGGDTARAPSLAGKGGAGPTPPSGRTQGSWELGPWGCAQWGWAARCQGSEGPPSWVPEDSAPPTLRVCSSSWCRNGAHGGAAFMGTALPGGKRSLILGYP